MPNAAVHDVIVVGAGPAGLAAAQALATCGHDVVVLEEHSTVGLPVHCTGVIGREAFDELELPRDAILGFTRAASFRAPDGQSVLIESDHIVAAVIDRARFDGLLAERATAAGAWLQTGRRVQRVVVQDRGVEVQTSNAAPVPRRHEGEEGTRYRARACVIACGAAYRFNRDLGLGVPRTFLHTAQVEMPFPEMPHIEVQFGRDVAPAGFGWTVPFRRDGRSRARLGVMCTRHSRVRFQAYAMDCAMRRGVDHSDVPAPRVKILPLAPVNRTYGPRVVAVGDAAGLVKPTTGGGIYYGLLSGRFAGDTLDAALRRDALDSRHLREYEARWRERIGPEIRAGLAFRAIASRVSDRGIRALVELARVDGLVPLLKNTASFNWHRRAALALLKSPSFRRIVLDSFLG